MRPSAAPPSPRARATTAMILLAVLGTLAVVVLLYTLQRSTVAQLERTAGVVEVAAQQRDALAGDVGALRSQVLALGEVPDAPPAKTTVDDVRGSAAAPALPARPGSPGATGAPGSPGATGSPGTDATGAPGSAGAPGKDGAGSPGAPGKDATGAPGAPGADATGAPGSDGAPGAPGGDSTVPGPVGPGGAPGTPGQAGEAGRGITDVQCIGEGESSTWQITYTDGTTTTTPGPCRIAASPAQ